LLGASGDVAFISLTWNQGNLNKDFQIKKEEILSVLYGPFPEMPSGSRLRLFGLNILIGSVPQIPWVDGFGREKNSSEQLKSNGRGINPACFRQLASVVMSAGGNFCIINTICKLIL
jgi:hypothetical protein